MISDYHKQIKTLLSYFLGLPSDHPSLSTSGHLWAFDPVVCSVLLQERRWKEISARLTQLQNLCPVRCLAQETVCSVTGRPGPLALRHAQARPLRASKWGPALFWPTMLGKVSLDPPTVDCSWYMEMRPEYWLSHSLSSRPLLSLFECLDFTVLCMCICPYLKQSAYLSWWLFLLVCLLAWHSLFYLALRSFLCICLFSLWF